MQIYLVRHGESVGNKKREFYGSTDYPLTQKGIIDAKVVAEKIKDINFDKIYTSGLQRAYVTARHCNNGRNLEIVRDERLNERDFGELEKRSFAELREENPALVDMAVRNFTKFSPPNGEIFEEFYSRVADFVEEIIEKDEDVLIVSHNGTMRVILMMLIEMGDNISKLYFSQGDYTQIGVRQDYKYLVCFNK